MSEQENIKLVQQAYDHFKAGNIQALLNLLSDDIKWQTPELEGVPYAGQRQGREGVAQFFTDLDETEEVQQFEAREFIAQGSKVVALGIYAGKVKSTGRRYQTEWAHVFTVRGGRIVEFQEYADTAAAKAYKKALSA